MGRWIVHLDMDSFFVSCERLEDPSLVGKPVLVGGPRGGRGVVASASYEARRFGVKSAMPLVQAEKLCPNAVFLPGRHRLYAKYSRRVYALLRRLSPVVEYASIDEFYLDLTGCERMYRGDPWAAVDRIRASVRERCGLPCTAALAANKYVAKIAGKTVKPEGRLVVEEGEEEEFLAPLSVERLHGAGERTLPVLREMGVRRIGDLRRFPLAVLQAKFGAAAGAWLYGACRGLDDSPVSEREEAKSVGHETTFSRDTKDPREIAAMLSYLAEKSCYRLRRLGVKARTVVLKLRYDDFQTLTRSATGRATDDEVEVMRRAEALFREAHLRLRRKIRLLGVSLSRFEKSGEGEGWLFPEMDAGGERKARLRKFVDAVKRRYGFDKLGRASSMEPEGEKRLDASSSFQRPKT